MFKHHKLLLSIFVLALLLRIIKLDSLPTGFHVDEVKVGWNAFSILKTGADDWGNKFALYYNSFGDYRPTGIFYITVPSILIFGLNVFAVRLPSALIGGLSVFAIYYFTLEVTKKKDIALLSALFLALSPWHIAVSRATSEVVISMFFSLIGFTFFLQGISSKKSRKFFASFIFLLISYLLYHSARLINPIFILAITIYSWEKIRMNKKPAILLLVSISTLTLFFASSSAGRARFKQVSVFNDLDVQHDLSRLPFELGPNKVFVARLLYNKPITYTRRFIDEYISYFSGEFLIGDSAKPGRYKIAETGLLTYAGLIVLFSGIIYSLQYKKSSKVILLLFLLAPIPAALTTEDAPNLHRSLFMIIPLVILQSYGASWLKKQKLLNINLFMLLIGIYLANYLFFLQMYSVHTKYRISGDRNYGASEVAIQLDELQKNYDKIFLTNIPDSLYPWIAFYGDYDSSDFNKIAVSREQGVWNYKNIIFSGQRCPSTDAFTQLEGEQRILVVDAEGCASENKLLDREDVEIIGEIKRPDEYNTVVYTLWSN